MRKLIVLLTGIGVLGLVNYSIYRKESLLASGRVVFLDLAPRDPRSLIQGDYMALRFRLQDDLWAHRNLRDGHIVVALDKRGIAAFRRLDNGTPLASDELRIRYRVRGDEVKLGTNAFFFQEGHEKYYRGARYGEARIDAGGEMLLSGMRGENLEKLGPP